jgi:ABC-type dipeptide/oligopeptide/nickel transport system ATPase subunit
VPDPILSVDGLTVEFKTEDGIVHAVTDVTYDLYPGETLGVVGESGSGKSVSVMAMLGLIPIPPGRITGGQALYQGRDLLKIPKKELRDIRGGEVAMIFQDPMTSLNPVFTIGDQIAEAIKTHNPGTSDTDARKRAIELLDLVGVPFAERRYEQYPHEFSGGMRQRAMIAMAIANEPAFVALSVVLTVDFNLSELGRAAHGSAQSGPRTTGGRAERVLESVYAITFAPQDRLVREISEKRLERVAGPDVPVEARRAYFDGLTLAVLANLGLTTQLAVLGVCLVLGAPTVYLWLAVASLVALAPLQLRRERLAERAARR